MVEALKKVFSRWFSPSQTSSEGVTTAEESVKSPREILTDALTEIYNNYPEYLQKEDLIHFPEIGLYGAFKYSVVKDILNDKEVFGVSTVHLALNDIYFSKNEEVHKANKRSAVRHLGFLSKSLRNSESDFVTDTFGVLIANVQKGASFNLVDTVINPIIFLNVLNEVDLFGVFPSFNPQSPDFRFKEVTEKVKSFFVDTDLLQDMLDDYLDGGGAMSETVNELVASMSTEGEKTNKRIAQFLRTMIFSAVESTASFVTSLILVSYTKFEKELSARSLDFKLVSEVANEVLRYYTPVPFIYRTVYKDAHVFGKDVKAGDMVVLYISAANNDPAVFEEPREFKLGRTTKNLSFGRGHLACIGEFASFRIALNVLQCLHGSNFKLTIENTSPQYVVHNSMYKVEELNAVLHVED